MVLLWGLKAFYLCNYLSIWDCLRVSTLKKISRRRNNVLVGKISKLDNHNNVNKGLVVKIGVQYQFEFFGRNS